jgi:hypothetical protein
MVIELYVEKLLRLLKQGVITIEDIMVPEYRVEVEKRLGQV